MDSESELISIISQILVLTRSHVEEEEEAEAESKFISFITRIISIVSSLDMNVQPEPGVISLISQMISLSSSISDSEPELELISLVNHMISLVNSIDSESEPDPDLMSLITQIFSHLDSMDSDLELKSLFTQIVSLVSSMESDSEPEPERETKQPICLAPQFKLELSNGKNLVTGFVKREGRKYDPEYCNPEYWRVLRLTTGEISHFLCPSCEGDNHEEYEKAPLEVKHPLHPKHSLQLILENSWGCRKKKCYCCDEILLWIFYYCWVCDCGMNIACVEKLPLLSIHHPKWHEHTLSLFPILISLTCNVCASDHFNCPFYICSPCDFVVHQSCITLPRVIRISRHLHRISFTPSFEQGDWSCGVCRKKFDNDCGGYSCGNSGCTYVAHSKCATQSNVWDGEDLEGKPEAIDEIGVNPFVRISLGIIQHFSHQQHYLRLDDNTGRDYDENKLCQACITPIYFGKFYSCMECNFILHEECANFSRKIQHPIHPHLLTLVTSATDKANTHDLCSACPWLFTTGFFYECHREGCRLNLHVRCGTISEPLVHGSHRHPLFLTSRPGDWRTCSVCKESSRYVTHETFNCVQCVFALCFKCAAIPQKVRYKHDNHVLILSYGKEIETSTMAYWCEACERKINPKGQFYNCDEYGCVTLHIECLIGKDLYMKPGSSWLFKGRKVRVLRNNHRMTRPICRECKDRCPHKIVFRRSRLNFCSTDCMRSKVFSLELYR
ncbi:unnamed protein product [Arabidopsis thaliana]|uniref:Cysteine/Histidine-rich C1 domain family protein n=1 Tax=Arabidopsis thaliana TaxID=3702 RepID=A0A5S9WPX7_ARATH|nr:unnamed protein product [Arabidopsis thaliana]